MVTSVWHRASLLLALLAMIVRLPAPPAVPSTSASPSLELGPADRVRALFAQFTAGVRGSRAPPAASA